MFIFYIFLIFTFFSFKYAMQSMNLYADLVAVGTKDESVKLKLSESEKSAAKESMF